MGRSRCRRRACPYVRWTSRSVCSPRPPAHAIARSRVRIEPALGLSVLWPKRVVDPWQVRRAVLRQVRRRALLTAAILKGRSRRWLRRNEMAMAVVSVLYLGRMPERDSNPRLEEGGQH